MPKCTHEILFWAGEVGTQVHRVDPVSILRRFWSTAMTRNWPKAGRNLNWYYEGSWDGKRGLFVFVVRSLNAAQIQTNVVSVFVFNISPSRRQTCPFSGVSSSVARSPFFGVYVLTRASVCGLEINIVSLLVSCVWLTAG